MLDAPRNVHATDLLEGLSGPGKEQARQEFQRRFRPILDEVLHQLGWARPQAMEVASEILGLVLGEVQTGRLACRQDGLKQRMLELARDRAPTSMTDVQRLQELWNAECLRKIELDALELLRGSSGFEERTIRAYELFAHRELPAGKVAEQLGMSIGAVYMANYRCAKRHETIAATLNTAYELEVRVE